MCQPPQASCRGSGRTSNPRFGPVRALSMIDAVPTDARSVRRGSAAYPLGIAYAARHGSSTPCNATGQFAIVDMRLVSTIFDPSGV